MDNRWQQMDKHLSPITIDRGCFAVSHFRSRPLPHMSTLG